MFVIIVAGRKQGLFTIKWRKYLENKLVLFPMKIMKHSNANRPLNSLEYHQYLENSKIYIANNLEILLRHSEVAGETRSKKILK